MKFSEQWLREWVQADVDTATLAHQLTMAGLEVDAIGAVAPPFTGVVVGEVLSVEPHPNADRLRFCRVDAGGDRPLEIVCGAANVAPGLKVPVALVGAQLPGGLRIEKSKLRGVASEGMLCSAKELGLAEASDGLMILPAEPKPGTDVRAALALDDVSIELGLTPNRGDCLSVAGVAREAAVINRVLVGGPDITSVMPTADARFPVQVDTPEACPRYLGRVIRGVNAKAPTPLWLRERLRRSGLRSISALVDITNYVLLELGQPMHAFDLAKLQGGILVRMAGAGEPLRLLDEQDVELAPDTLIIADEAGPVAMAGIMGGARTAVSDETVDVFLESAHFTPSAITGRARRYGLHTDSSHRFERGVDPHLPLRAIERATALLLAIAGGEAGPIIACDSDVHLPRPPKVKLRAERLWRLLGVDIPRDEVADILRRLGMTVAELPQGWEVVPPSFRFDIRVEADVIEEIARIHGYSRLPQQRPLARLGMQPQSEARVTVERIRELLVDRGYQEAITYSFVDPRLQALIEPTEPALTLANPISADMGAMRTSLWPGLTQALIYNQNRQQGRVRLFEIGRRFRRVDNAWREEPVVAGIAAGTAEPEQWGSAKRRVDFYDVKADVTALLGLTGRGAEAYQYAPYTHSALHTGQAARITDERARAVGLIGVMHPEVQQALGLADTPVLFELEIDTIGEGVIPRFRELSKFPAIRRDIAVVVNETVGAESVRSCVAEAAGILLQELQLFDVYRGKGIDSEKKSLALGLTLQDSSRTLTDEDVDLVMGRVLAHLGEKFGATLRE